MRADRDGSEAPEGTSMRVPCVICGAMILPTAAEFNCGLCGQCARDPARAKTSQERRCKIAKLGAPSVENIKSHLVRLTEVAAREAGDRFSDEGIYAFLLQSDPDLEGVVPRAMTEKWVSRMPPGARWGGCGWYDEDYMIREEDFGLVAEWTYGLDDFVGEGREISCFPATWKHCGTSALRIFSGIRYASF